MNQRYNFNNRSNYSRKIKLNSAGKALGATVFAAAVMLVVILIQFSGCGDTVDVSDISSYVSPDTSSVTSPVEESTENSVPEESEPDAVELPSLDDIVVTAWNCYVVNTTTGEVLYSKNAEERAYPASITKLMTASVALKYCDPSSVFTAGDELELVGEGSSLAWIKSGMKLKLSMLIDAMLLPSGNDAAYIVAVNVARQVKNDETLSAQDAVKEFAKLMNKEAAAIGCTGTNFVNPDGYHDDNHYSTAEDLAKICQYARTFDVICRSVAKEEVDVIYESGETNSWRNSNYLVCEKLSNGEPSPWYLPYVTGMKTGSTDEAGKCLAVSAEKDGVEVIAIILRCNSSEKRFDEAYKIMTTLFGTGAEQ